MSIAHRQVVSRQAPILGLSERLICSPARPNYKYESPEERTQRRKESQQSRKERAEKRSLKREAQLWSLAQKNNKEYVASSQPCMLCPSPEPESAAAAGASSRPPPEPESAAAGGSSRPPPEPESAAVAGASSRPPSEPLFLNFEEYLRTLNLKESTIKSVHRSLSVFKKILLVDPVFLKKYARSSSTINVAEFFANMSTDEWKDIFPFETRKQQDFYEIRFPHMKSKLRTYVHVTTLFTKEIAQQTPKVRESGRGTWLHTRGILINWFLSQHSPRHHHHLDLCCIKKQL